MKVVIAGSRSLSPTVGEIESRLQAVHWIPTEIISGTAAGVDRAGERWAEARGVPVKQFPADWAKIGRDAGWRRNAQMAAYADAVLIFWDGVSKGTMSMQTLAVKHGKPLYVVQMDSQEKR